MTTLMIIFIMKERSKSTTRQLWLLQNHPGKEALDYLRSINEGSNLQPDLIFLDINMPGMNGWDFLKEFDLLDKKIQSSCLIVMLTSSDDPADLKRVRSWSFVSGFITKPLSKSIVSNIIEKYFWFIQFISYLFRQTSKRRCSFCSLRSNPSSDFIHTLH